MFRANASIAVPRPSSNVPAQSIPKVDSPGLFTSAAPDLTPMLNLSTSVVVNPDRYPEAFRRRIQSLNSALRLASKRIQDGEKLTPEIRKQAWKAYLLCRNVLISQPADIPFRAWTTLWKIFSEEHRTNLDRMAHINYLGGDMVQAGVPLDSSQQLLYIEACFLERDHKTAFEMWENAKDSFGSDKNAFRDYLKLGIQMFCQSGQVKQALQTASFLLNTTNDATDCRMLLLIMEACLALRTEAEKKIAWALYIRLRAILGPKMNMQDYDAVTSIFLGANQPDLALGAFKDMMLTGSKSAAERDSSMVYRTTAGIGDGLDLATINNAELKWEDSRTLAKLPAQFNNKFFFGKWIKKLIGDGELEAAKKVLDLMVDRGIYPDAKHMNGLIGALYRTGTVRDQTVAEDLAWKMIAARIQFVEQRAVQSDLKSPLRAVKVGGREGQKALFLAPKATIETFSILVQQYRRRQKQDRLVDLFRTLKKAQIPPNTIFMNQLIMVDAKSHQSQWAWDTYLSLVDTHGVVPDFETFVFLWHLMKKATDPVSKGSHRPFATCRSLFAEMVKRAPDLNRGDKMPRDLYDEVILCFSLAEDQVGTAVALRALQRLFNLYPTEKTVRTVVLQLARLRLRNAAGSRPRRLDLNKATQARIAQVTEVLAAFKDQRTEELLNHGIKFEELPEEAKLEESLLLLSNLLRYVYQAKMNGLEAPSASEMSKLTAEQMGVPECDPWAEEEGGQGPV
jgi:pentatricopeptide repeat protein